MNKNGAIFILVVLIFIGGVWGSLADRKRIALEKKLKDTVEQMQQLTDQTSRQRDQVLGKTAGLQETLADREDQLEKARKELVSLRKEVKAIEAQLSACSASLQKMNDEKAALQGSAGAEQNMADSSGADGESRQGESSQGVQAAAGGDDIAVLREQLQTAELAAGQLRQKLDAANAQLLGLDKLLEEKNAAMEETSQDMDRLNINMDVLLAKIADQQDEFQEIQAENRELVKELAAKNEEIADLREEVMRQPVRE